MNTFKLFRHARVAAFLSLALASIMTTPANAATTDFVEFYNTPLNYYFRTSVAADIAALDAGRIGPGWSRTGSNFKIWPTQSDAPAGALPMYRYFLNDPLTHFYTAIPSEIQLLDGLAAQARAEATATGKPFKGFTKEGIEAYVLIPVDGKCPANTQPVYRNYNPKFAGKSSSHRFMTALSIYQDMADLAWNPEVISICVPGASTAARADAYRLLSQTTFGPNEALAARVESIGVEGWLNEQFNAPKSNYPVLPFTPINAPDNCKTDNTKPATDPQNTCARDTYSLFPLQTAFIRNAVSGEDQLRQRVAVALSQVLVTSAVEINLP